ncbi:hypothetical protein [Leptotrichia sp. oral taxon 847]|uniref:hypothetical protein n=1 Tax=Leptotrichia sp. oral taxon 847 TaxID=1785996 RepID=UPI0007681D89|nr:hypothetical protein [Leptotrichia sp. oral taxon 847]AMD95016.1 hypothetical protein AXF11_05100 [Leptotrichia sp. oral taxon 847]
MKLDLEEKDLLREIINFKIVSKRDIESRYNFRQLKYILMKINDVLKEINAEVVYSNYSYVYYFGSYNEKIFKLESEEKKLKRTYRRELIELFLLFSDKKLSIYRIIKKLNLKEDEKNKIKSDVQKVLFKYGISYEEYKDSINIKELFRNKGYKLNKIRREFLEEILLKRLKNEKNDIYSENFYIKNLELTLDIKNIKYIQRKIFLYLEENSSINSMKEKYKILTKFLMDLKSQRYEMEKEVSVENGMEEKYFTMIKKILKKENIKFYPKIVKDLYKNLKTKSKKEKSVIEDINKKIKELSLKENSGIELYEIEEKRKMHNDEEFIDRKIKKIYVPKEEIKRIKTIVLMDIEENNIMRIFNEIWKISGFLEIVEVFNLSEFKKNINKTEKRYEQIIIISTSSRINDIKNFSKIPIYLLNIENLKTFTTPVARKYYLIKKVMELRNTIEEYRKLTNERQEIIRIIKRNKKKRNDALQKRNNLQKIKNQIEKMKKKKIGKKVVDKEKKL